MPRRGLRQICRLNGCPVPRSPLSRGTPVGDSAHGIHGEDTEDSYSVPRMVELGCYSSDGPLERLQCTYERFCIDGTQRAPPEILFAHAAMVSPQIAPARSAIQSNTSMSRATSGVD